MRTLCGLLSLYLCLNMLTFARVVNVQDGQNNVIRNGVKTTQVRMTQRVKLTIPKPPDTGPTVTYSSMWVAIPLCFGLYCIYGGERAYRSRMVKINSIAKPNVDMNQMESAKLEKDTWEALTLLKSGKTDEAKAIVDRILKS